jgi:phage shock protein C
MKKLTRPKQGRVLGGVALGIANYFDIDVTVVRLLWVFLLFPGGLPGLLPYLVMWLIVPEEL